MKKVLGMLAALLVVVSGSMFVSADQASAAPQCAAGYVCMWTGRGGGGTKYSYASSANHTHRVASVHYNYNTMGIKFMRGHSGTGKEITRYNLRMRGFRNWSSNNWDVCRSHQDISNW
ncbi:MAG: hypothetical protein Q4B10_02360 [Actinomycetaceae bacterium]|nr:hypothetical protein [Actinomycetaceae bacterium]